MSLARVLCIARRELLMGPRSPIFLYAVVVPILVTVLIQVVFGRLLEPAPRLGIVDDGQSEISAAARGLDGIEVRFLDSADSLRTLVEGNDLDAGLILPDHFDEAVRNGTKPVLQLFVGGDSLASNRMILAITVIDLVRSVAGAKVPVDVAVATVGDAEPAPLTVRLLPGMMIMTLLIAGTFVPSASLVEEKERGTLHAVLVTPTQMPDVLAGKGAVGVLLGVATGLATLALNDAFGAEPLAMLAVLVVATVMSVEFGLLAGAWASDMNILFALMKSASALLWLPVVFYIWPDLPSWVARLFPTYYFLSPIYDIAIKGASLGDVAGDLAIGAAICVALLPVVYAAGRRMEGRLAAAT